MEFIRKNKFFVVLCTIFILIAGGLVGYRVYQTYQIKTPVTPNEDPVVEEPVSGPSISKFSGEYNRRDAQVELNWSINSQNKTITSSKLYQVKDASTQQEQDLFLSDVKNMSSFTMPQDAYNFPTGVNTFKLVVIFSDNTKIEKTVSANVALILSTAQSINKDKDSKRAEVTLTYRYGANNPVEPPEIKLLDTEILYYVSVKGTETSDANGFVVAKTTYVFTWSEVPSSFTLRWYFKDIGVNYDFVTDFTK